MKSIFPVPPEVLEYWKAHWQTETCKSMGRRFGYDGQVVIRLLKKNGITIPRELSLKLRGQQLQGRTKSTPEVDEQIRAYYLIKPVKALARDLGVGTGFLKSRMKQLKLIVPKEIIEQRKKHSQLKIGNTPFNKGKKLEDFMTKENAAKFRENTFLKGNIPHNSYNQPGKITIRRNRDGSENYKFICIELGKWELLHQYTWIQHNGPIPKGHTIRFVDGNSLNCDIANLQCISMAANLSLNQLGDKAVATRLVSLGSKGIDRELREEIINHHPHIIELKRRQLLLQRQIRNEKKKNILDTRKNPKAEANVSINP